MEFKQILQKLEYCNSYNCSSLIKKIIVNIRHVNKSELLYILEVLQGKVDIEFQVKLISILTAYLLFNNSNRDVIIKNDTLYDTVRAFLSRGLPLKTAITLNFVSTLLYAEDDGGSRSKTLTLHAQNLIRNSGCLIAMSNLFTNHMLHNDTWKALCRCLAEVCRGCEHNQTYCFHLVPVCVKRCLQGNTEVLTVLQSLLLNHKRNTNLFMETDGVSIFYRKDYLRLEACLQLLNTVIQNVDYQAIYTMKMQGQIHKNLHDLLITNSPNSNIVQWTKIISYYFDLKLKRNDKPCSPNKQNVTKNLTQNMYNMDTSTNNTQILLQNIMRELLSYPSEGHGQKPFNNLNNITDKISKINDTSSIAREMKLHQNKPRLNSVMSRNERMSFSFLMNENLKFEQPDISNESRGAPNGIVNQNKMKQSFYSRHCDTLRTFNNKSGNIIDFNPTYVSTPKKLASKQVSLHKNTPMKRSYTEFNKSRIRNRTIIKKRPKTTISQEKSNVRQQSMSSRIFEAINESCTTVIRSVKNVFTRNRNSNTPREVNANTSIIKNNDQNTHCSYSFTKYMRKRETELMQRDTNKSVSSEVNTKTDTINICNTCDDTLILHEKLASNKQLKYTIKKLKLGINLYGCDFKRISKTMWPRQMYMTPTVLYNLYRKLILK